MTLGVVLCEGGDLSAARAQTLRAAEIAADLGRDVDVGLARGNLGYIASLGGDLPGALEQYETAERVLSAASAETYLPRLHADHARALADAALFDDSVALMDRALTMLQRQGNDIELAGALVTSAEIRLAQGDMTWRRRGRRRLRRRGTESMVATRGSAWRARCRTRPSLVPGERARHGPVTRRRGDESRGRRFGIGGDSRPPATRRRCGAMRTSRTGSTPFRPTCADPPRGVARPIRFSSPTSTRWSPASVATRWEPVRAITRGLRAAMSAQAASGSIETRAHAAVHGYALTEIGARLAVADRRPRELLERIEATRMMSTRLPALRPPADPTMAAMLTELRSVNATIADPSSTDEQRHEAERARSRVERDMRRRSRTVRGDVDANVRLREELGSALAMLGDRQLLAHAALDGRLLAVSVVGNRARLHDLGFAGRRERPARRDRLLAAPSESVARVRRVTGRGGRDVVRDDGRAGRAVAAADRARRDESRGRRPDGGAARRPVGAAAAARRSGRCRSTRP